MSDTKFGGGFLGGLFIGGLLGAGLALLLAPKSGQETREELVGRSAEIHTRAAELAERARESADELVGRGRSTIDDTTSVIRDAYTQGRQAASEQSEEMQRRFREPGQYQGEA